MLVRHNAFTCDAIDLLVSKEILPAEAKTERFWEEAAQMTAAKQAELCRLLGANSDIDNQHMLMTLEHCLIVKICTSAPDAEGGLTYPEITALLEKHSDLIKDEIADVATIEGITRFVAAFEDHTLYVSHLLGQLREKDAVIKQLTAELNEYKKQKENDKLAVTTRIPQMLFSTSPSLYGCGHGAEAIENEITLAPAPN